jgi:hypothetical protein
MATKLAVGIVPSEDAEATELRRWFSEASDIRGDARVAEEVLAFIETAGAKTVVMTDGIIGCPHEEGIDYEGDTCVCPFWAGGTVGVASAYTSRKCRQPGEASGEDDEQSPRRIEVCTFETVRRRCRIRELEDYLTGGRVLRGPFRPVLGTTRSCHSGFFITRSAVRSTASGAVNGSHALLLRHAIVLLHAFDSRAPVLAHAAHIERDLGILF